MNIVMLAMRAAAGPLRSRRCCRDEQGATLVEYALLLALMGVAAIVALVFLGGSVSNTLNSVGSSITTP